MDKKISHHPYGELEMTQAVWDCEPPVSRGDNGDGDLPSVPRFLPGLAAIALVMLGELVCPVIFLDKETQA